MADVEKSLEIRAKEGNLRKLKLNPNLIDFCSNDYLGLASSEKLKANFKSSIEKTDIKAGATGARLISGNSEELEKLEKKISEFHAAESALVFSTGYQANLALYSCIGTRNDTIFYDELSHASIKDGVRMSQADSYSFKHNDLNDLEKKLKNRKGDVYIAVEALYSMDGDFAPLEMFSEFSENNSLNLIVDEAHTNGIYGKKGEGRVCELKLENKVFARNMTFGKALGVQGAAIIGRKNLKEFMINFSRPFIYSTSLSPYLVLLIDEAYNLMPEMNEARRKLFSNINYFNETANTALKNQGPIQAVIIEGNAEAKMKAEFIQQKGIDVRAVLSPTVKKGRERLRICLHSFNTEEEIKNLTGYINE